MTGTERVVISCAAEGMDGSSVAQLCGENPPFSSALSLSGLVSVTVPHSLFLL